MAVLYIVSTPIGNLEDITLRALRVLKEADVIVCEDTRHTRVLLDHYEIKKPLYSFHERSSEKDLKYIVSLLESGKNLAYVTDAGTPGIADPVGKLVSRIMEHGTQGHVDESKLITNHYSLSTINIVPIPGPSSLSVAISICGFNMQEFRFFGFLPHKKGRQTKIKEVIASDVPVVLFESKYRIKKLFEEFLSVISTGASQTSEAEKSLSSSSRQNNDALRQAQGDNRKKDFACRQCIVANDLTKKFETIYRGTIEEVHATLQQNSPRGEFVVVVDVATNR